MSIRVHHQPDPFAVVVETGAVQASVFTGAALAQHRDFPVLHQLPEVGQCQPETRGHQRAVDLDGARRVDVDGDRFTHAGMRYPTAMLPFMAVEWPGKLQKNSYGPSPWMLATGKVTVVDWPPPISSVWAMTRVSPDLR